MSGTGTTTCCDSLRTRFSTWETSYNNVIGKLSGKTFECVNKLQLSTEDSTLLKAAKVFAAFLGTATILPLVGLFVAAGAAHLWNTICGKRSTNNSSATLENNNQGNAGVNNEAENQASRVGNAQLDAEEIRFLYQHHLDQYAKQADETIAANNELHKKEMEELKKKETECVQAYETRLAALTAELTALKNQVEEEIEGPGNVQENQEPYENEQIDPQNLNPRGQVGQQGVNPAGQPVDQEANPQGQVGQQEVNPAGQPVDQGANPQGQPVNEVEVEVQGNAVPGNAQADLQIANPQVDQQEANPQGQVDQQGINPLGQEANAQVGNFAVNEG